MRESPKRWQEFDGTPAKPLVLRTVLLLSGVAHAILVFSAGVQALARFFRQAFFDPFRALVLHPRHSALHGLRRN